MISHNRFVGVIAACKSLKQAVNRVHRRAPAPPNSARACRVNQYHRVPPGSCTSSKVSNRKYMARRKQQQRDDQRDRPDPLDDDDHEQNENLTRQKKAQAAR